MNRMYFRVNVYNCHVMYRLYR